MLSKSLNELYSGIVLHLDLFIALAGLIVGFTVGLTGMGGGALTTPVLVLVFGVQPLAAVSSDLVAAVVMKPVGGAVHWRGGTVDKGVVKRLVIGSIPGAFSGAVLLRVTGEGSGPQEVIKIALGVALVAGAAGIALRVLLGRRQFRPAQDGDHRTSRLTWVLTVVIGLSGGLIVGLTSVGSGSIMIVLLMLLYPRLSTAELVGTDLVQAVPLVASAALGHLLFGDFRLGLTLSLLLGSIPGVYLGARLSVRASLPFIRPALAIVLLLSGAKLLHAGNPQLALLLVASVGLAIGIWPSRRRRSRLPRLGDEPLPATDATA